MWRRLVQSFGLILDFLTSDNKGDRYAHAHTRTLICSPLFSLKCDNEILINPKHWIGPFETRPHALRNAHIYRDPLLLSLTPHLACYSCTAEWGWNWFGLVALLSQLTLCHPSLPPNAYKRVQSTDTFWSIGMENWALIQRVKSQEKREGREGRVQERHKSGGKVRENARGGMYRLSKGLFKI